LRVAQAGPPIRRGHSETLQAWHSGTPEGLRRQGCQSVASIQRRGRRVTWALMRGCADRFANPPRAFKDRRPAAHNFRNQRPPAQCARDHKPPALSTSQPDISQPESQRPMDIHHEGQPASQRPTAQRESQRPKTSNPESERPETSLPEADQPPRGPASHRPATQSLRDYGPTR
jgi:hypothetical protein